MMPCFKQKFENSNYKQSSIKINNSSNKNFELKKDLSDFRNKEKIGSKILFLF